MEMSISDRSRLMEALCAIPVSEFRSVLSEGSRVRIEDCPEGFTASFEKRQPTYAMSQITRAHWVQMMRGIFLGATIDDIDRAVRSCAEGVMRSEFGHDGLSRQAAKNNPYWFEYGRLLDGWKEVYENPSSVAVHVLDQCNHGRSGFTRQARRVYFAPQNDVEVELSAEYRALHVRVVERLVETAEPTIDLFGHHMDVQIAFLMLTRLGADLTGHEALVEQVRKLVVDSAALPTDHDFAKGSAKKLVTTFNTYFPEPSLAEAREGFVEG